MKSDELPRATSLIKVLVFNSTNGLVMLLETYMLFLFCHYVSPEEEVPPMSRPP